MGNVKKHILSPTQIKQKPGCYGNQRHLDIQIEHLKHYWANYSGKRKLSFFWTNIIGHKSFTGLRSADVNILKFLEWSKVSQSINNTVVIMLSDHGYRMGGPSSSRLGRKEANNPWLMIHVPSHIKERYPHLDQVLKENTKRIVSAYDIYQTVLAILNNKAFEQGRVRPAQLSIVRRNLFSPIPEDRTCADAGVPSTYCMCQKKTVYISNTSVLAQRLADRVVGYINNMFSKANVTNVCCELRTASISEVSVIYADSNTYNVAMEEQPSGQISPTQNLTGLYNVIFYTTPGLAMFSGTVSLLHFRRDMPSQMTPKGGPARLNVYGKTSSCADKANLRKYCY